MEVRTRDFCETSAEKHGKSAVEIQRFGIGHRLPQHAKTGHIGNRAEVKDEAEVGLEGR